MRSRPREVELAELGPLGDEHDGVGALDAASAEARSRRRWISLRASASATGS